VSEVEKTSEDLSEDVSEVLSEAEMKRVAPILAYLQENEKITPQDARRITGKSAATVRRYMNMLYNRGIIETNGNTNALVYSFKLH
jgi:ATP-dependent DNA helicase RecG